ncbi:MAG: Plasmid maintenance system killer protein [Parcubacteria group bacterium GW2011_GWA2_49_9]|nr:MAG: Plasmid maintenance system killer protein [Parcubacteria group bacterium GW2011_GWA2_49_9]
MRIEFKQQFLKRYAKMPASLRSRCDERLELFAKEPKHPLLRNHALTGDRLGKWSINITGNWRALYEFQDAETVVFVEIGTHP